MKNKSIPIENLNNFTNQDVKKSYYSILPADVRYDKDLTANSKLLYSEITALTNEKGYCWASNNYFAELYKVTPQAISRWIKILEQKNYLSIEYIKKGKEITQRVVSINVDRYQQIIDGVSINDSEGINKELKRILNINTTNNNKIYNREFESFWDIYDKKVGNKEKLIKKWLALTDEERQKIFDHVPKYKLAQPNKKYRKNPETYINNKSWNDEIIGDYNANSKIYEYQQARNQQFTVIGKS